MRVLILGGTRFLGRSVTRQLLERGADVTLFHRGVTGESDEQVATVIGDRSQPDGLAGLAERRFDAVLDMSAYFSDWTRAAAEALTERVSHYVFVSSGAVYRPSAELPWPETTRTGRSRSGVGTARKRSHPSSCSGQPARKDATASPPSASRSSSARPTSPTGSRSCSPVWRPVARS